MAQGPRIVARAQTLAVLQGLDPKRKRILLQFLYEAGLIFGNRPIEAESIPRTPPIVELDGAALREADLSGANLRRADLRGADIEGAKGKSKDELEDHSSSLEGATMPDGSKHP